MILLLLIAFIIGVFLALLPNAIWMILFSACFAAILVIKKINVLWIVGLMASMSLGIGYYHYRYHHLNAWQLPKNLIKKTVLIDGRIIGLPKEQAHAVKILFKGTIQNQKMRSQLFSIDWYQPYPKLMPDDQWQFSVSLRPPSGLHNPGGFDYKHWLILHGIRAVGYVKKQSNHLIKRHTVGLAQWRLALLNHIEHILGHSLEGGVIAAITMGSRALIRQNQWLIFQNTGTNHLIAIAGLHLGFVALIVYWLIGFVWNRSYYLLLLWPRQQAQAAMTLVATAIYAALAGFSLPTQRAFIMVLVIMGASLSYRTINFVQRLLFAFCLIVIWDPFSILFASLWLSFAAVSLIAYVCNGRYKAYNSLHQLWRIQFGLCVGLAPFTLFYFGQMSWVSMLANVVAVPWVGFVLMPLCMAAVLLSLLSTASSSMLFKLAGYAAKPLCWYLITLSRQKWAVWSQLHLQGWEFVLALAGVFLLLCPRGLPGRWLGLLCWLPMIFYKIPGPKSHQLWVTSLDVGQGLSVVIRTAHHVLLYDAGPKSYSGFDAGASVVLPYLSYYGIHKLDMMMISHGDNDHIGGSYSILKTIPVTKIMTSIPQRFHQKAAYCHQGQHWVWDGVNFTVLWPRQNAVYEDNNSSCVLRIVDGQSSVLLTGDIEKPVERQLLDEASNLQSTLLVVPHHGSKTSSSLPFLRRVSPQMAIFSTGLYNRYHFPSPIVLKRYQNRSVKTYNTAISGAVAVHFDPKGLKSIKTALRLG